MKNVCECGGECSREREEKSSKKKMVLLVLRSRGDGEAAALDRLVPTDFVLGSKLGHQLALRSFFFLLGLVHR